MSKKTISGQDLITEVLVRQKNHKTYHVLTYLWRGQNIVASALKSCIEKRLKKKKEKSLKDFFFSEKPFFLGLKMLQ